MILSFFKTVFYIPLYNGLIFLLDILPWADLGVVVVLFTIIVKFLIYPISKNAVKTQLEMKKIEPELAEIKKKYPNKQEQAEKIMNLYKEKGMNPFSSLLLILIQFPIIISLYYVFWNGGLPNVNNELLYSFISAPGEIDTVFLGMIDLTLKSIVLGIGAGLSSLVQIRMSIPKLQPRGANDTFKEDLARSMNMQMRYVFPVIVLIVSYNITGAVALYWITSNLFTIGQEVYLKRKQKTDTVLSTS